MYLQRMTQVITPNGMTNVKKEVIAGTTTTLDPWSQIAFMFISTLSFIAAFAWNDTMTTFLNQKFGRDRDFKVHLIYAIIITIFAGIAIYFIVRYTDVWISKRQQEEEQEIIG